MRNPSGRKWPKVDKLYFSWVQFSSPVVSSDLRPHGLQHARPPRPLPTPKSFPGDSEVKLSACNAGDLGSIPGSGRSPGEMATHSSILAWKIPWMEEPGGLQSTGLQRVGRDWKTSLHFLWDWNENWPFPVSFNLFNRVESDSHGRSSKGSWCQASGMSFDVKEAVLIQSGHTSPPFPPSSQLTSYNSEAWGKHQHTV